MTRTQIKYLLVIIDSKLHIVLEDCFDTKRREFYVKKTNSEMQIKGEIQRERVKI